MSIKVMTEVWKYSRATDPSTMLVEIALADHANEERSCFPGNKLLAAKCRMKVRAVQRQIRKLENLGEIRVEPRLGHSNLYVIRDYEMTPVAQDTPVNLTPLSSTTPGGVAGDAPPLSSTTPITIKESSREPSLSFSEDFNATGSPFNRSTAGRGPARGGPMVNAPGSAGVPSPLAAGVEPPVASHRRRCRGNARGDGRRRAQAPGRRLALGCGSCGD